MKWLFIVSFLLLAACGKKHDNPHPTCMDDMREIHQRGCVDEGCLYPASEQAKDRMYCNNKESYNACLNLGHGPQDCCIEIVGDPNCTFSGF